MKLRRIISGGQTGADVAGLVVGRRLKIETGGTAPKGWRTEKGPQPVLATYGLVEASSSDYRVRTQRNVRDADATLIFTRVPPTGGSKMTAEMAEAAGKAYCTVDPWAPDAVDRVRTFLSIHHPRTLNVAGSRESKILGITHQVIAVLEEALRHPTPTQN